MWIGVNFYNRDLQMSKPKRARLHITLDCKGNTKKIERVSSGPRPRTTVLLKNVYGKLYSPIAPEKLNFPHGKIPIGALADAYNLNEEDANKLIAHVGASIDFDWILNTYDGYIDEFKQYYELLDKFEYKDSEYLKNRISKCTYSKQKNKIICRTFTLIYLETIGSCVGCSFLNEEEDEEEICRNSSNNKNNGIGFDYEEEEDEEEDEYPANILKDDYKEMIFYVFMDMSIVDINKSEEYLKKCGHNKVKELFIHNTENNYIEKEIFEELFKNIPLSNRQVSRMRGLLNSQEQVIETRKYNKDTTEYIENLREQTRETYNDVDFNKKIAQELHDKGASAALIGCILYKNAKNIDDARSKIKNILGK